MSQAPPASLTIFMRGLELDAQIGVLERLRDRLDGCIGCGCLSLRTCALNNPGDGAADLGSGPVFLEPEGGAAR